MKASRAAAGCLRPAPETFLDTGQIAAVQAGRRDFLRGAFLAAAAAAVPAKTAARSPSSAGDPAILEQIGRAHV